MKILLYCPIQVFDAIKDEEKDCGEPKTNIKGMNEKCCWSNNHGAYIPNRCLANLTSEQLKQIDTKRYEKNVFFFIELPSCYVSKRENL